MWFTLSYSASSSDHARFFLQMLFKRGVKINVTNKLGISALHILVFLDPLLVISLQDIKFYLHGKFLCSDLQKKSLYCNAEAILRSGIDLNDGDKNGFTSLHRAASFLDIKMIELLENYGASVKKENMYGMSSIDILKTKIVSEILFLNYIRKSILICCML